MRIALAFGLFIVLLVLAGRFVFALILAALVGFIGRGLVLDQLEIAQQAARELGECGLVIERERQRIEIAAPLLFYPISDKGEPGLGDRRRLLTGQPLAQQQPDRGAQRHLGLRARPDQRVGFDAAFQRTCEIGLHAQHPARPQRLDACLLDGIEHRSGHRLVRREATVDALVVQPLPQREAIRIAARLRDLIGGKVAPRHRYAQLLE